MSTKIYNGYLLDVPYSIDGLNLKLQEMKQALYTAGMLELRKSILNDLIYIYDVKNYIGKDGMANVIKKELEIPDEDMWLIKRSPLMCLTDLYVEKYRIAKASTARDFKYDFDCQLQIIPIEGKILCLFYAEKECYKDCLNNFEFVHDFHYQNSTDKPKDITEEEWEERRLLWEKVFKKGIAFYSGFTLDCFCTYEINSIFTIDDLVAQMTNEDFPTKENRILRVISDWDKNILKDCKGFSEIIKVMRSDEYKLKQSEMVKENLSSFTDVNLLNLKGYIK